MLTTSIVVPAIASVLILGFPRGRERFTRWFAFGVSLVPLILMIVAWIRFEGGPGFELVESVPWIPSIGVTYQVGIDGLSLPLLALTALLFSASIVFPVDLKGRAPQYFAAFLFLEAASLGLFLALDLILFFVFFDLSLVGMYFLIAIWGHGDAHRSALKFFIYTLVGSLALLLGILGIYLNSGDTATFDMIKIISTQPIPATGLASVLIFWAIAFAFMVKTPLAPFHTWLPPAHVDAPAPASTILAGVLLKMGTYGFVRILLQVMPETFDRFALPIAVIAVISIIYGAMVAMAQTNLKRLVAYTSVNHMGYVILGVAVAATLAAPSEARSIALTGATIEMVAHGLITGALFLLTGSVLARAKTYEMGELGGLAAKAPALTGITLVAAFASLGLPGLAGFVAEFQIFAGTLAVYPWLAAIGLLGIVITAALFLRMVQRVFLGPLPDRWSLWTDLGPWEIAALAPMMVLIVVIGVVPAWLIDVINSASKFMTGG
ncbi:MAG: NADH-quinone oxidoreductase subunit M [Armatimonadetes bacterium]|nr:MAG: NADH-quinone oxidoreductase subunit M [Armatimonadota bacterium]